MPDAIIAGPVARPRRLGYFSAPIPHPPEARLPRYSIGLDFGTESVRALVVDVRTGAVAGQATHAYAHGVIDDSLPTTGARLPPDYALQHPLDWIESMFVAGPAALR